ncbi:MAG TPA: hypothetical protein VNS60_04435 [Solirubrobacterales bacterium]|nr:hypothetical protein [Solirubrobacterales bacterium]
MFGRSFKRYLEKRDEEFKSWSQEREEKLRALQEETREFNREILLRNEKVYTRLIVQMEENTEQIRANTRAVLSMLDRFNGSSA